MLTINGNNFGPGSPLPIISIDNTNYTAESASHTKTVVSIPSGTGKDIKVTIFVDDQKSNEKHFDYDGIAPLTIFIIK